METNRKSHSHNERDPVSDTDKKLPYDKIAPDARPFISYDS